MLNRLFLYNIKNYIKINMLRHRKINKDNTNNTNDTNVINDNIIYSTNYNEIEEEKDGNIKNDYKFENCEKNEVKQIQFDIIDTFVFSSSEMYNLSILGYIDKLMIEKKINIDNIKNFVSPSFGTIISVYLAFNYKPKEILQFFFEHFILVNDNIFNMLNTFGIFETSIFVDNLLKPLVNKIGYIPTLKEIYNLTHKKCIFISYNFTKNKMLLYSYKTHPDIKIDELINKCCIVPFIFKKYKNNNVQHLEKDKIDTDYSDLYLDYSFIDNEEYEYSTKLFNQSKILYFKVNVLKNDDILDIKKCNMIEYIKYIFDSIQEVSKYYKFNCTKNISNLIEINIHPYNKLLLLDKYQKYKVLINLFCSGFDNNINNNKCISDYSENILNICNKDKDTNEYSGIVIAGGGTNTFSLLGCIKYCIENNIINMNNINTLIGTSAGSYICLMLTVGFTIDEMIEIYVNEVSKKLEFNFDNIYISEIIEKKSIYSNKLLIEMYETAFIKYRNGEIPTLLDIKNKYNKELVFTVYNLSKNKLEYLNYINSPDLLVTHGCAMSSCIPIAFNPIEYKKCYYIDGGIKSNFSIEKTQEYLDQKFIGFGLNFITNYSKMNLFDFFSHFIFENSRKFQRRKIKKSLNCNSYCINIVYDEDREPESLFYVNKNIINKMILKGYNYMKEQIKK